MPAIACFGPNSANFIQESWNVIDGRKRIEQSKFHALTAADHSTGIAERSARMTNLLRLTLKDIRFASQAVRALLIIAGSL